MSPFVGLALAGALLLTSITATPVESGHALQREDTTKILKRLGGVPCPDSDFTCVTIRVPLNHFDANDQRKIDVTFAVLPATGRRKGMFVTATGGPGTSGLALADSYTATFDPAIRRRFDIVFFDQRGVGRSGGLTCPDAAAAYYLSGGDGRTPAGEAELKISAETFAPDCVAEMGNPSELLPFLGTEQAIEDLEIFRRLMQDEKFWLYGESYGTQYAQTYAAKYGKRLAGLVLDGVVDLTLDGFAFYSEQTQAFADVLLRTLEACNADPVCAEQMNGDAIAAYDALAARLTRGPVSFRFPLPSGGTAQRRFDLGNLETVFAGQAYNEGDRMMFNRALAAYATRRDLAPLARLLYLSLSLNPETLEAIPDPTYSDAMYYSVECQDYAYTNADDYLRAGDGVEATVPRMTGVFYGDLPCVYWPVRTTNFDRPEPLVAEGIPVLVLGATADPATPYRQVVEVFRRLDNAYLITQTGGPHVIFGRGVRCVDDLVTDFLVHNRLPAQRETMCDGVVTDDYVPLAPTNAGAFASPLEALTSAESEINYLPEYYYWDGETTTDAGCTFGGTLRFEPRGKRTLFSFHKCTFTRNFRFSGFGSYDANRDRFTMDVMTTGRWACNLKYSRTGDRTKVTGVCDGQRVSWER
ncbi:MAG: alpha/beta hydrolase [Anaerolineales bacterium]|nr:alpha/beta hydrolase [Anaerolineales bacterium]